VIIRRSLRIGRFTTISSPRHASPSTRGALGAPSGRALLPGPVALASDVQTEHSRETAWCARS
jgi:hypothetical protein